MPSFRFKSDAAASHVANSTLACATLYTIAGVAEAWRTSSLHILTGAAQSLALFAAGLSPLLAFVLFFTFHRGELVQRERRACLVGAALTSLILLPLLRLAF